MLSSFGSDSVEMPFGDMMKEMLAQFLTPLTVPVPVKILVCDDNTTVFWDDGKVTQVTRMTKKKSGIEAMPSTEDAIAFALVKRLTADWIDKSAVEYDDDSGAVTDDGRRNWMKTALKKVEVLPSRKELRAAKAPLILEAKARKQLKLEAKIKLLPENAEKSKEEAKK